MKDGLKLQIEGDYITADGYEHWAVMTGLRICLYAGSSG